MRVNSITRIQRNDPPEFANQLYVHEIPARVLRVAFRIVVFVHRVKSGLIGIGFSGNFDDADDPRNLTARVVEEREIPQLHLITHHIAGLIIAYPVPGFGAVSPRR